MSKNCENCEYFWSFGLEKILPCQIQQGECRINPPTSFRNPNYKCPPDVDIVGRWPSVALGDFCASWRSKNDSE